MRNEFCREENRKEDVKSICGKTINMAEKTLAKEQVKNLVQK